MTALTARAPAVRPQLRTARVATTVTFAINGLFVGSWAPRIPGVKAHLHLSAGALGLALLATAVGTILVARTIGARTARHGTAAVTRVATVLFLATAWLPGAASNLFLLWIALLGWGACLGAMDVAMNAQGVTVEAGYGRPVLAGFHAGWSIGTFVGAVLGGLGAALDVPVAVQQGGLAVVAAALVLVVGRWFVADPPHDVPVRRGWRRPRRPENRLLLLGIAAIFALMAEGAVADWSGVLLRDHLHVDAARVGLAYVAFTVTMTAGRFVGDRVTHALGPARCLAAASLLGALGLAAGMAGDVLPAVVAGFALYGVGLSIMVPVLFSTAADTDGPAGPAIAAVSALGCIGLLVGPSLIGLVAQLTGVSFALFLLPPFTVVAGGLGVAGVRLSRRRLRSAAAPASAGTPPPG